MQLVFPILDDPNELTNLIDEDPDTAQDLRGRLTEIIGVDLVSLSAGRLEAISTVEIPSGVYCR
jgi:hypothetical protein